MPNIQSQRLQLQIDSCQAGASNFNRNILELKRGKDNSRTLKKALIPKGSKINSATIECLNRCITQGDITTFVFRIDNTIIRARKLEGSFYSESIRGMRPYTCYESSYRQGIDLDKPCLTEVVNATLVPMADIFRRSRFTALAYQCDGSLFINVYNRLPNQEKSISPTWFLPDEPPSRSLKRKREETTPGSDIKQARL